VVPPVVPRRSSPLPSRLPWPAKPHDAPGSIATLVAAR